LRSITAITQHYKQDDLAKQFMVRLSALIPAEELEPQASPVTP
jgi:hypothetical protein